MLNNLLYHFHPKNNRDQRRGWVVDTNEPPPKPYNRHDSRRRGNSRRFDRGAKSSRPTRPNHEEVDRKSKEMDIKKWAASAERFTKEAKIDAHGDISIEQVSLNKINDFKRNPRDRNNSSNYSNSSDHYRQGNRSKNVMDNIGSWNAESQQPKRILTMGEQRRLDEQRHPPPNLKTRDKYPTRVKRNGFEVKKNSY